MAEERIVVDHWHVAVVVVAAVKAHSDRSLYPNIVSISPITSIHSSVYPNRGLDAPQCRRYQKPRPATRKMTMKL